MGLETFTLVVLQIVRTPHVLTSGLLGNMTSMLILFISACAWDQNQNVATVFLKLTEFTIT